MIKQKRKVGSRPPKITTYTLPIVIEHDEDGYFVTCPSLQGCYTQGDTYEEALSNMTDAIKLHIADRIANGESVPVTNDISLTVLSVTA